MEALAHIITGFIYHLQVVPLVSHTSHFSLVLMNLGTLGFARNLMVKPEKQSEPHLDQVNKDMEIPHSNVPLQQFLQLHLAGCKGTITQGGVFPLTLLDALSVCCTQSTVVEDRGTKLHHWQIYHSKTT